MSEVGVIGLDLAKHVFQVHGADASGQPVIRKQLRWGQVLEFFGRQLRCMVAMVTGDTPYDAETTRGAGLAAIGVLCGGFTEQLLRQAACVAVCREPQHLLDEYDSSPREMGLEETDAVA